MNLNSKKTDTITRVNNNNGITNIISNDLKFTHY